MIIIEERCVERTQGKNLHLDLKTFRLQAKGKHSAVKQFQSLGVQGMKLLTLSPLYHFIISQ